MLSAEQQKRMDEMLRKQELEFKGLAKEFKLDGVQDDDDQDPELAELNKALKKQERLANDDGEINDDDLLGELNELDDGELASAKVYVEQLIQLVEGEKKKALAEKKANNIKQAMAHMAQMKEHQKSLDEQYAMYPSLKNVPDTKPPAQQQQEAPKPKIEVKEVAPQKALPAQESAPTEDDVEMEEQIHDFDKMVAMSVIEAEVELMRKFISQTKGHEKEFYQSKLESLEFSKSTIETNIGIGIVTPEKYLRDIKAYLADQIKEHKEQEQKLGKTNKHVLRIKKRIELLEKEIGDMENPEPEEEEEEKQLPEEQQLPVPVVAPQSRQGTQVKPKPQEVLPPAPVMIKEPSFDENKFKPIESVQVDNLPLYAEDRQTFDMLQDRITDYRDACRYMMDVVGDKKRAGEFLKTAENFKRLQNMIAEGKKVDILKVDPPITPAVILGMSDEERQKKFNELIAEYNGRFEESKSKAAKLLEAAKQLKKKEQQDHLRQQAAEFIEAAKKYSEDRNHVTLRRTNPWQAPPVTHFETVFVKKEKVIEDLEKNQLRVELKTSDTLLKTEADYLKLEFGNEKVKLEERLKIDRDRSIVWNIEEQMYKTIDKKELVIILKKQRFFGIFGTEHIEEKKFKLGELSTKCEHIKDLKLGTATFQLKFQVHTPLKAKDYEEVPTQKLVIDAYIPPFREYENKKPKPAEDVKQQALPIIPAQPAQPRKTTQAQSRKPTTANKSPAAQPERKMTTSIPEGMTQQDVLDPDNMRNMTCASYIERRLNEQKTKVNGYIAQGVMCPADEKEKFMALTRQNMAITAQINSGKITEEQYKNYLNMQLTKDKVMLDYFNKNGLVGKARIVTERMQAINEELASAE